MAKILRYDKIEYDLTDTEFNQLTEKLTSIPRPPTIFFRGNLLKSYKIEVINSINQQGNVIEAWSDEELTRWENEIFPRFDKFNDYLISEGSWVVNDKYPDGIVKNYKLYMQLTKKWYALQNLRQRQATATPESREQQKEKIEKIKQWVEQKFGKPI